MRFPRSRQTITVQVPEQTITIPGIEQLRRQFGFILERTAEDNYTASVKLLTDSDVSQITQSVDQSEAMFMNASTVAPRNAWHKAIAKVSGDEVTVEVYNDNGTRLENMASSTAKTGLCELGIFMTYGASQVLAFKNLKVETVDKNPIPISDNLAQQSGIEFLYPYIRMSLLLAGTALAVVYLKGRKKNNVRSNSLLEPTQ
jgi:hypothetical protein